MKHDKEGAPVLDGYGQLRRRGNGAQVTDTDPTPQVPTIEMERGRGSRHRTPEADEGDSGEWDSLDELIDLRESPLRVLGRTRSGRMYQSGYGFQAPLLVQGRSIDRRTRTHK